jgi:hypothetical protein
MRNETHTGSRGFSQQVIVYLLSAVSIFILDIASVRAADLPVPSAPPGQYSDSREYYEEQLPPPREDYLYRRPAPYYSEPPITYYGYAPRPPAVLTEDEPYYLPPRYSYRYPVRGYRPYVARGYGRHDGRWARGYHRW